MHVAMLTCQAAYISVFSHAGNNDAFLVSAGGAATGMILKCFITSPDAVEAFPTHQGKVTAMASSQEGKFLVQGFHDGAVRAMHNEAGPSSVQGTLPTATHVT